MDNPNRAKELVFVQIFYLYVVPTLLLYFGVVPEKFRLLMIFGVALLLYGIIKREKWTYHDLAIRQNFMKEAIPYFIFTVAGISFLVWLANITPHEVLTKWWQDIPFLLLFIPFSVLQELIFRGILMKMLIRVFSSPVFIICLNAVVFALIHILYINSTFVLPMTFIAGIGFAWMYYKYPNLILISISHTILNFTAVALGFFVLR